MTELSAEAIRLVQYALHLRTNGERAPGGDENWTAFDKDAEILVRSAAVIDSLPTVPTFGLLTWIAGPNTNTPGRQVAAYDEWVLHEPVSHHMPGKRQMLGSPNLLKTQVSLHRVVSFVPGQFVPSHLIETFRRQAIGWQQSTRTDHDMALCADHFLDQIDGVQQHRESGFDLDGATAHANADEGSRRCSTCWEVES